jgi:RNA polymerase sigma-70 factor (ECF subfamily)
VKAASAYTEPQLVAALKMRDRAAFTWLYDHYSNALFGVINRIVGSEAIAEDVLQEAFIRIWKNIESYTPAKGALYTWLLNVCRNAAIDEVRSKAYRKEVQNRNLEDNVHAVNMKTQVTSRVDHIGLNAVVDRLKPEHRSLIDKVYFEGYTQEQVAKELGMPLGTVKTRIRAAMSHLRGIMKVKGQS